MERKPTLLLHSCCGPCSTSVIERLVPDYQITVLYYNPNIFPEEEYLKRKSEQLRLLKEAFPGVSVLDCEYDPECYTAAIKGLEHCPEGGERCTHCFVLRLEKTALLAKEKSFSLFATTLTVSPHKNAPLINSLGRQLGEKHGIPFLGADFKKKDGYLRSLQLSKQYSLYRQHYCGCLYSLPREEKPQET